MASKSIIPLPRVCYGLLPSDLENGKLKELTPIIVVEGVSGYYETQWRWERKYAKQALDSKNAALGITPEQADEMVVKSIFNTWTFAERIAGMQWEEQDREVREAQIKN